MYEKYIFNEKHLKMSAHACSHLHAERQTQTHINITIVQAKTSWKSSGLRLGVARHWAEVPRAKGINYSLALECEKKHRQEETGWRIWVRNIWYLQRGRPTNNSREQRRRKGRKNESRAFLSSWPSVCVSSFFSTLMTQSHVKHKGNTGCALWSWVILEAEFMFLTRLWLCSLLYQPQTLHMPVED